MFRKVSRAGGGCPSLFQSAEGETIKLQGSAMICSLIPSHMAASGNGVYPKLAIESGK